MSDQPNDFDLKFLPDWLKEPAGKNPYADFEGERAGRPPRHGSGRPPGGPRGFKDGPRDFRGPRPGNRPGGGNRPFNRDNRDSRDGGHGKPRPGGRPAPRGQNRPAEPRPPASVPQPPVPLQVDFIPCPESVAALCQQIKASRRAYPLFGIGRMFLNKPERHRVRVASNAPACPIYQAGEEGPVFLDRQRAEREAFQALKASFYAEETVPIDPPKGNFTAVARCGLSGVLLGPTNHHGYQPALRRLYEARFSRRMAFPEFLRQIEILNDPAAVEQWKAEASSVTRYRTLKEEEPKEFQSPAEVEAHFRAHYLEGALCAVRSVEIGGAASRAVGDRAIREAIRAAWEKERVFPAQLVNQLRPLFLEAGLQIWKHRKRVLYVSEVRPVRFGPEARNVSEQVASILNVIEAAPKCARSELSTKLLKPHETQEDFAKLKSTLAADLHWLVASGHVIEFHDGTLDLPLAPKEAAKEEAAKGELSGEPSESAPPEAEQPQQPEAATSEASGSEPQPAQE